MNKKGNDKGEKMRNDDSEKLETVGEKHPVSLGPRTVTVTSQDEKFMEEVRAEINKIISDPHQNFNIDKLCKKLYISRSTFFRKVREITGTTPNEYIMSYRLDRAAQLLIQNYGNVTEVAMAMGFFDPYYFSKCFKNKFGQSPKVFQRSHISHTPAPQVKINIEFTFEDLDSELVLRLPLPKLEKLFKSKVGNPQRSEINESIKNFYKSVTPTASNKALKDITPTELMKKIRMVIDDLKEDAFR